MSFHGAFTLPVSFRGAHIRSPCTTPVPVRLFSRPRTILIRFDARPALAAELSRQLRNDDRVIRHTLFRRPKGEQIGVIKNDGISPLDAVMNSGSLMGTLGDLNTLLEPQGAGGRAPAMPLRSETARRPGQPLGAPSASRTNAASPAGGAAAGRPSSSPTGSSSMDSIMSLTALLNKRPGGSGSTGSSGGSTDTPSPASGGKDRP